MAVKLTTTLYCNWISCLSARGNQMFETEQYFSFPSKLKSYLTSLSKDFKFRHRFVYSIVKVTLAMKCLSEKTEFLLFPQSQHSEARFQQSAIYKKGTQITNVSSNKPEFFIFTIISWPESPLKIK